MNELFDIMSDAIPTELWRTLGGVLAQSGSRDIDPIGLVNKTPQRTKPGGSVFNIKAGGDEADRPTELPDGISELIPTGQLEDVTDVASLVTTALSGNTHAQALIEGLGLANAATAIPAAEALGEGALNIAAAQSLAQQGAVGTATGGAGALGTVAAAAPYAAAIAYAAYIMSMRNSNGPPNLSATDILRAAEGETVKYEGGEGVAAQDVALGANGLIYEPGSGQYIDTTDEKVMSALRQNAYFENYKTGLDRGDRGTREEILQAVDEDAIPDTSALTAQEIIDLATENASAYASRAKAATPKLNWAKDIAFGGLS
jgi:hypothetical protein